MICLRSNRCFQTGGTKQAYFIPLSSVCASKEAADIFFLPSSSFSVQSHLNANEGRLTCRRRICRQVAQCVRVETCLFGVVPTVSVLLYSGSMSPLEGISVTYIRLLDACVASFVSLRLMDGDSKRKRLTRKITFCMNFCCALKMGRRTGL